MTVLIKQNIEVETPSPLLLITS